MDIASNRTRAGYLAAAAVAVMIAGCGIAATDFEYVYLPGTELESGANLPFTPAIKVRGGNIVFTVRYYRRTGPAQPSARPLRIR